MLVCSEESNSEGNESVMALNFPNFLNRDLISVELISAPVRSLKEEYEKHQTSANKDDDDPLYIPAWIRYFPRVMNSLKSESEFVSDREKLPIVVRASIQNNNNTKLARERQTQMIGNFQAVRASTKFRVLRRYEPYATVRNGNKDKAFPGNKIILDLAAQVSEVKL